MPDTAKQHLDGTGLRRWSERALACLQTHQREIDDLNVFPVADSDTGTNLALTMAVAVDTLQTTPSGDAADTVRVWAHGALLGARGNSGVILAELLRGLAEALPHGQPMDGPGFAAGLAAGADAAYQAVASPVEGTMLSVARAAARGAAGADPQLLPDVVRAATAAAALALAATPDQLPALARAGVVDAGGRGLLFVLEALADEVGVGGVLLAEPAPAPVAAVSLDDHEEPADYAYEVQYRLDAPEPTVALLRATLADLGDSLVVAPADAARTTWHVHVHVNDVGAAIEAGVAAGRPYRIAVTRFADQQAASTLDPSARAWLVPARGRGLALLLATEGANVIKGDASTEELVTAIRAARASWVVVLPDDEATAGAAALAAREVYADGIKVEVVPTRSPVQALAALAVRDPARRFADDVIAMAEAAGACRAGALEIADTDGMTARGPCEVGDALGYIDGAVTVIDKDITAASCRLVDLLLRGGGELVTAVAGAEAPADLAQLLKLYVAMNWPSVEVQVYDGGQPDQPLLVGVE